MTILVALNRCRISYFVGIIRNHGADPPWIVLRRMGLLATLVVVCAALSGPRAAEAEDAGGAAAQYVRDFQERETLLAQAKIRANETEWLTTNQPGDGTLALLKSIDPEINAIFRELLEGDAQAVHKQLLAAQRDAEGRIASRVGVWQRSRTELYRRQVSLFETNRAQQAAGAWASLMSFDNRWFWLAAVLAIASLVGLGLHSRRHEVRKVFHGGRSTALTLTIGMGVLLLVVFLATAATFLFGDRLFQSLLSASSAGGIPPQQRAADVNAALAKEIEILEATRATGDSPYQAALDAWHQSLSKALPSQSQQLAQDWRQSRQIIHDLSVDLAVEQRLVEAMQNDVNELRSVDEQLQAAATGTGTLLTKRRRVRVGFGLSLVVLTALSTLAYWRADWYRHQQTANTCPRCAAEESLTPLDDDRRRLRCGHRLNRDPAVYCRYTFATAERGLPKLSFPTLGVAACGKTQWAAMVYRQLTEGRHPRAVRFGKNESAKSDSFDQIVTAILNREGPPATAADEIPMPLCLQFKDRDRLGPSDVMACVFDYAGAITTATNKNIAADDYRRRRALEADGLLLMLDPTEPGPPQAKALETLGRDLRRQRHLNSEAIIRTPVAVCITKIDLLAAQSYAGDEEGRPLREFYRQLAEVDPDGEELSRRAIKARAQLFHDLRRTIWPHWNLEQQLDSIFGRRSMFFPLSAVGLDNLGEANPREQTIAPFGILEPLMWLLHVNGHPCLD